MASPSAANKRQHGVNDKNRRNVPTLVGGPLATERVVHVAAGFIHNVVLTAAGRALACGYGGDGRLGLGDSKDRSSFTPMATPAGARVVLAAAGVDHTLLSTGRGVLACGGNRAGQLGLGRGDRACRYTPTPVPALAGRRVTAVSVGGLVSFVLADSVVHSFGVGSRNGHGSEQDQTTPKAIAALAGVRMA